MSLVRLIYYGGLVGGWAAFLGWLVAELVILRNGLLGAGTLQVTVVSSLVGAAIGGGLSLVAGAANGQWRQQLYRLVPGLIGGGVGGALGGLTGDLLYSSGLPRALGWAVMGLCIGVVEGLYERTGSKVRNGLIGGGVGGLLGGLLFEPLTQLIASQTGMAGRATAFVLLGICIGALIGVVQVVLKEAWLTVVDGYRPGRQLILSNAVTVLGRAESASLPFFGPLAREVEKEHARIVRLPSGRYAIEDAGGPGGTKVNNATVQRRRQLNDGDVVGLGQNSIRFNERQRAPSAAPLQAPAASQSARVLGLNDCSQCGRTVLGPVGERYCAFCKRTF